MPNHAFGVHLSAVASPRIIGWREKAYSLIFVAALTFQGLGNKILGVEFSKDISTYILFSLCLLLLLFKQFVLPRFLLWLYAFIVAQTFLLNWDLAGTRQVVGFLGIIIFSATMSGYVFSFRDRLSNAIRVYYGVAVCSSVFALLQTIVFGISGKILSLQTICGGIPQSVVQKEIVGNVLRSSGFESEPASLAIFLAPAFYLAYLVLQKKTPGLFLKNRLAAILVILGMASTISLNAFMIVAVIVLVVNSDKLKARPFRTSFVLIISGLALGVAVQKVSFLNLRVSSLIEGLQNPGKVWTTTDLSTFATLSNIYVSKQALVDSYYLGTGIKTHSISYDKYVYFKFYSSDVLMELNKEDASSLYLRILSEMGVVGLFILIVFLVKYRTAGPGNMYIANTSAMLYIVLYGVRNGGYMSLLFWFFVAIYYFSFTYNEKNKHTVPN